MDSTIGVHEVLPLCELLLIEFMLAILRIGIHFVTANVLVLSLFMLRHCDNFSNYTILARAKAYDNAMSDFNI